MSKCNSFLVDIMKWQGYKELTGFSRLVLFKPAASTRQKINPIGCYNL